MQLKTLKSLLEWKMMRLNYLNLEGENNNYGY